MPGADVAFEIDGKGVCPVETNAAGRVTGGQRQVESLRGRGVFKMSTDEIVTLTRGPPVDEC